MISSKVVVAIILAVVGSNGLWTFIQNRFDRKDNKEDNVKNISFCLDEIKQEIITIKEDLSNTKIISTATARDRLNYLSNKYLKLGYIPKEEVVNFKLLGETYISAGGNSEVATKFNLCINTLEIR